MLSNTTIRPAKYRDYKSLCEIFAQANAEHCVMRPDLYRKVEVPIPKFKFGLGVLAKRLFNYQPVSLQVAEHEGRVIGAVYVESNSRSPLSWSAFGKEAYLDNIVVAPAFRRQGVGTALLEAAQQWAQNSGHTHIYGKIINQNEASLALFEKAGFSNDSTNVGRHLG